MKLTTQTTCLVWFSAFFGVALGLCAWRFVLWMLEGGLWLINKVMP